MPSRMTKNRVKDFRYRPGKAEVEDEEEEFESEEEEEDDDNATAASKTSAPAPKASTFPTQKKLAIDLSKADQQKSTVPEVSTRKQPDEADLEGFETASESEEEEGVNAEGSSEDDEEESSEEEDSSSDDEPKKPMLAPKFISKAQRMKQNAQPVKSAEEIAAEEERRRKEKADEMLQAQMERDQAARAAGKKAWDDEDNIEEEVDDTDGLDHEAEYAAWKLRELKRVRRDRRHQDGVAVGLGPGHRGRADVAAGPAAVLDHDLLAQVPGHPRGDETRHEVGRAAGRERHDERDGPARILALSPGRSRHPPGEHRQRSEPQHCPTAENKA